MWSSIKSHWRSIAGGVCAIGVPILTVVNPVAGIVAGGVCSLGAVAAGVKYKQMSEFLAPMMDTLTGKKGNGK
jgi:hypothetical protein